MSKLREQDINEAVQQATSAHAVGTYREMNAKLQERLLSALAAIEKIKEIFKTAPKDWFFEYNRRASHALSNIFESVDLSALREHDAEVRKPYDELLYAVERKWPNETRHQTALRYIRQAEQLDPKEGGSLPCGEYDARAKVKTPTQ